jgi:predicted permease
MSDELDDELQFHLEEQTRLNIAKGMPPAEADRHARASLGSVAAIKDDVRDIQRFTWFADLFADWKHGIRNLRHKPALVLTATLSLALGIAVNSTAYSLAMATVFSLPSVRDPGSLFEVAFQNSSHVSEPNLRDLESLNVAGYAVREYVLSRDGRNLRIFGQIVSRRYFEVTGTPVALGRALAPGDESAAVVSARFAQGENLTLGADLILSRETFRVVGILPEDFRSTIGMGLVPDVMVPVTDHVFYGVHNRSFHDFTAVARAQAGQSANQLRQALNAAAKDLERQYPKDNEGMGQVRVFRSFSPLTRAAARGFGPEQAFLGVLAVLATIVLLIACANVAGVLLAHGIDRRREIALRLSIGAGRFRIVRQLLAEAMLIAFLGVGAGLLVNRWLTALSKRIGDIPGMPDEARLLAPQFAIDGWMLAYLAGVLVATTLTCGLLPALQTTRPDLASALKGMEVRAGRLGLRKFLAGVQVALSLALLVLSALFYRSSELVRAASPGFDVDHTMIARPSSQSGAQVNAVYMQKAEDAVKRLPGVVQVSWASLPPLGGEHYTNDLHPESDLEASWPHNGNTVTPHYFETLDIPLLAGRAFRESDAQGAPGVVIVNEAFAHRYYPGQNAVGKRMREGDAKSGRLVEVIGVVRNSKYSRLGERTAPLLYRSMLQPPDIRRVASMLVRFDRPAAPFAQPLRRALEEVDAAFAVRVYATKDQVATSLLPYRAGAAVLVALGALGLLLAFGGLYGVMAYTVSQRTHEIGIRLALGATGKQVVALITRDALNTVAAGSAVGLLLALAAGALLHDFLAADLNRHDPALYFPVVLLALAAGLFAAILPALVTLRRDPVASLRHD